MVGVFGCGGDWVWVYDWCWNFCCFGFGCVCGWFWVVVWVGSGCGGGLL